MVKKLKKIRQNPGLNGESINEIIGVSPNSHSPNVAEVQEKSNALDEENIAKKIAGQ